MPNPFDKKKNPDAESKPAAPAADAPAPADAAAPAPDEGDDLPEDLQLKPADAKPGAVKPASAPGETKGKGSSAPLTPGQGEPDVKPHDQPGAKAEPEASEEKLPAEADPADAKPKPTGLPSLASMTKAEAESAGQDPMNNPTIQRLVTLVQGLAKVVQDHHARLGAMSVPGQAAQSSDQQAGQFKPGMPGAKPMVAPARPGMPVKPGMPAPGKPGMLTAPGMKPGMPSVAPGAPSPASNTLSLEQLTSMMGIVEAAGSSRIPRQAAAIMISRGFGIDPETAAAMVAAETSGTKTPDPLALGAALAGGDPGDDLNPEEEEMEGVDEEQAEESEEEPDLAAAPTDEKNHKGFTYGKYHRRDVAVGRSFRMDANDAIALLEARRAKVVARIDALTFARGVYYDDLFGHD